MRGQTDGAATVAANCRRCMVSALVCPLVVVVDNIEGTTSGPAGPSSLGKVPDKRYRALYTGTPSTVATWW